VGLNRKELRADKDLVRAVALEVIAEHGIDSAPVDPLAIAESLGILVQASNKLEGSFSGCPYTGGRFFWNPLFDRHPEQGIPAIHASA
jgi:hypothetical protein